MWRNGRTTGEYRECIVERAPENKWLDEPGARKRGCPGEEHADHGPGDAEIAPAVDSRTARVYRGQIRSAHRRHRIGQIQIGIGTVVCAFFAVLFLLPIILTMSFS